MLKITGTSFAALLALSVSSFGASTPQTFDMGFVLLDERGEPIKDPWTQATDGSDPQCDRCKPLTLGATAAHALMAPSQDDAKDSDGLQKIARGLLAVRLKDGGQQPLSDADLASVQKAIGRLSVIINLDAFPVLYPGHEQPQLK